MSQMEETALSGSDRKMVSGANGKEATQKALVSPPCARGQAASPRGVRWECGGRGMGCSRGCGPAPWAELEEHVLFFRHLWPGVWRPSSWTCQRAPADAPSHFPALQRFLLVTVPSAWGMLGAPVQSHGHCLKHGGSKWPECGPQEGEAGARGAPQPFKSAEDTEPRPPAAGFLQCSPSVGTCEQLVLR